MGLDCPNIHKVLHWGAPSDIESYLQETGRAGRDDKEAKAVLYYSKGDLGAKHVDTSGAAEVQGLDFERFKQIQ